MPKHSYAFEAIGTQFEIITPNNTLTADLKTKIHAAIEMFDRSFSRFRADSLVRTMARQPGTYELPGGSEKLFELYESLYILTKGRVSPLIGNSLEAIGYDSNYSLRPKAPVAALEYQSTVKRQGRLLRMKQPALLDIGAAGKGFLIDHIGELLAAHGISSFIVDGSGDILHKGKQAETIGLEDPLHLGRVIGELSLHNKALCASAINRRTWGDGLHHIVDAKTGVPTNDVIATWVLADNAMTADGLATALFFVEPEVLNERYTYEYIRVRADHRIDFSPGCNKALY